MGEYVDAHVLVEPPAIVDEIHRSCQRGTRQIYNEHVLARKTEHDLW